MSTHSSNHVVWRCYVKARLTTESPLIIGSGEDQIADVQCQRDGNGRFLIPGTSIAGKLRALAKASPQSGGFVERAFGESKDNGRQSMLIFSDAPLIGNDGRSSVRDSVRLKDETKTAADTGKFDYETIDPGQSFEFRMQAVLREKNGASDRAAMESLVAGLLAAMNSGTFSLGAKTNRGFGKLSLSDVKTAEFDFSDAATKTERAQKWLDWEKNGQPDEGYSDFDPKKLREAPSLGPEYITVAARFKLPAGLLIRSYSADPAAPDVAPVAIDPSGTKKGDGIPVVPGTSWSGVLRHSLRHIARDMGALQPMEALTNALFGRVIVDNERETHRKRMQGQSEKSGFASNIVIEESRLEGSHCLNYTRNAIDRFTGGVVESKLFTERLAVGGSLGLKCLIRKTFYEDDSLPAGLSPAVCVGALFLALMDIGNGIEPVGGATSVGRGILRLEELSIDGSVILRSDGGDDSILPTEEMRPYLKAAAQFLQRGNV